MLITSLVRFFKARTKCLFSSKVNNPGIFLLMRSSVSKSKDVLYVKLNFIMQTRIIFWSLIKLTNFSPTFLSKVAGKKELKLSSIDVRLPTNRRHW